MKSERIWIKSSQISCCFPEFPAPTQQIGSLNCTPDESLESDTNCYTPTAGMIAGDEIGADAFLGVEGREKEGDKRDGKIFSIPISAWFDYRAILTF
jgi:hypothetical protein